MSDDERAELEGMRAREAQWEAHLDAQEGRLRKAEQAAAAQAAQRDAMAEQWAAMKAQARGGLLPFAGRCPVRCHLGMRIIALVDVESTVDASTQGHRSRWPCVNEPDLECWGARAQVDELTGIAARYRDTVEENKRLYNEVQDLKGNIRVFCRVRPLGATGDAAPSARSLLLPCPLSACLHARCCSASLPACSACMPRTPARSSRRGAKNPDRTFDATPAMPAWGMIRIRQKAIVSAWLCGRAEACRSGQKVPGKGKGPRPDLQQSGGTPACCA
jgi:hypothetical protein